MEAAGVTGEAGEAPGEGWVRGRPAMPEGYGIMPQGEGSGLMRWERVDERLAGARNYWVVTTSDDGSPHAMPVWGLWLDGGFCFSTDPASRKGRNLAARPRVVVHLESGDDVVVLEGAAEPLTGDATLARFCDAYEAKYAFRPDPRNPAHGFYRVRPVKVLAWLESDYAGGATRWLFAESDPG